VVKKNGWGWAGGAGSGALDASTRRSGLVQPVDPFVTGPCFASGAGKGTNRKYQQTVLVQMGAKEKKKKVNSLRHGLPAILPLTYSTQEITVLHIPHHLVAWDTVMRDFAVL
jgi:hypothetical protein